MIQRVLLVCGAAVTAVLIMSAMEPHPSADACATKLAQSELTAARRGFKDAARFTQEARLGGSLYAAAKLGLVDQEATDRAMLRQGEAYRRLQRARAQCAVR